ncbi:hypothetical protein NIES2135_32360 [Leptolyngbya boryana NIES-2135]|jgi:hypothetical protein|uniref:Uncharacterized protein n=1 Tax=Leptolyngbya boryana NIES-2135 TaxID=1973484 RepID=A0A1Z4JI05_LEPBY|nr:hypothetical protein NIES2135_32360 [Leptolyngbya boryana NIES-2135]
MEMRALLGLNTLDQPRPKRDFHLFTCEKTGTISGVNSVL